jgi:Bacterial protein of unknown function (DUF853)
VAQVVRADVEPGAPPGSRPQPACRYSTSRTCGRFSHLTSDEGRAELKQLGGLSAATAGVMLRELIGLEAGGGDAFFGETEFARPAADHAGWP